MDYASIGSVVVALIALLVSIYNNGKKATEEDSVRITQIMARMEEMSEDIKEIKEDFRREVAELKASYQVDHDRITKLEYSLDTAWRRIDELRTTNGREA